MKKWVITGAFLLALVAAGASVHWWQPKVMPFSKDYGDVVKTIASVVAIASVLGALARYLYRLWRPEKESETLPAAVEVTQSDQSGGVNVLRDLHAAGPVAGRDNITFRPGGDIVVGTKIVGGAQVVSALHGLPPPPRDFTGRKEELDDLMAAVEQRGATISGMQGMGGVGKTALALKLAELLAPRYPDAQFYLDLKGVGKDPLASKDAMAHVIRAYHPDVKLPEQDAELRGRYQSVLHNQRAILLMDNARDAQQVEPLIPPPSCLLLVTSRQHFTLPGLLPKNLDALPPAEARDLLLRIAPRLAQHPNDSAATLAQLCAYLPLALRAVGSALAAGEDLDPAHYARKLADARERLKLTATHASLQLSYDLLTRDVQERFCVLAVFLDFFDTAAAAAVWEIERDLAQGSLSQLLLYSFVEFRATTTRYRLHDLVRLFADARLGKTEREDAARRHAEYYKEVARAANALYLQGGESLKNGLALFDLEWGNIEAGQAWAAAHAGDDDAAAALCSAYPDAGTYCIALRLHPREWIRWLEAALAAARQLKDRAAEGWHLGNLGIACDNLGEYRRAIEYYEQHLQIAREIGDRRGEGAALGNLGLAYYSLGDYRRAIEYHEHDLQIEREIGNQRGEANALGNLGLAYASLGEYRRAIEYYEEQLQITREISDRRGEGQALGNLGLAYDSLGEYRRAIEYHEQWLKIAHEIGDRRGEGNALGNLGNAYYPLSEYRRAIEYYEQHLQIAREIGDRRGEGNALWNMSLAFDKLGDRTKAIAHAEAALKIYEQIESPYAEKVRAQLAEWRK